MTETEKELITAVLRRGVPLTDADRNPDEAGRQAAISALATAQLVEACDCGTCRTYTLHYRGETKPQNLPGTCLTAGTQSGDALVLAHLLHGRLTTLEVVPTGSKPVTELPAPGVLTF